MFDPFHHMNKEELYNKMSNVVVDDCIADSYLLEYDGVVYEYKELKHVYKDLTEVVDEDFAIIRDNEKKSLENKNLKVLIFNISHLVLGSVDWNTHTLEETSKLLYGVKYWVLKEGGSFVVDVMIKNNCHVEMVFLFIQLFNKYV